MSNAAEILTVKLDDPNILKEEWEKLIPTFDKLFYQDESYRLSYPIAKLTPYFQNILEAIKLELGVVTEKCAIFYHDIIKFDNKMRGTTRPHVDTTRAVAVTVPIHAGDLFAFYTKQPDNRPKLTEMIKYGLEHPTIVNISNIHSTFIVEHKLPRAILQLNCYESFSNICERNKDKIKLL